MFLVLFLEGGIVYLGRFVFCDCVCDILVLLMFFWFLFIVGLSCFFGLGIGWFCLFVCVVFLGVVDFDVLLSNLGGRIGIVGIVLVFCFIVFWVLGVMELLKFLLVLKFL